MTYRVLVCGGRDYWEYENIRKALEEYNHQYGISLVITGAAKGADQCAEKWAKTYPKPYMGFPANWSTYGPRAGFMRNAQMLLEGNPDAVLAFPGGKGTAMMVDLAKKKGVVVFEHS